MQMGRWVLLIPVLSIGLAVWISNRNENEAQADFSQAVELWRGGLYLQAIQSFSTVQKAYPRSQLADDALWEIANIRYVNFYDVTGAIDSFESLLRDYPKSPLTAATHMKLAEILDKDMGELPEAVDHWQQALECDLSGSVREQVEFAVADALFRSNQVDESFENFSRLEASAQDEELARKARLRIGTILQIRKENQQAIDIFREIVHDGACGECRLQAQLGLIESYELLDELPNAIAIAKAIDPLQYSPELKEALVNRLLEKQKYYEPKMWDGQ